jgi:hypothetical protein
MKHRQKGLRKDIIEMWLEEQQETPSEELRITKILNENKVREAIGAWNHCDQSRSQESDCDNF